MCDASYPTIVDRSAATTQPGAPADVTTSVASPLPRVAGATTGHKRPATARQDSGRWPTMKIGSNILVDVAQPVRVCWLLIKR